MKWIIIASIVLPIINCIKEQLAKQIELFHSVYHIQHSFLVGGTYSSMLSLKEKCTANSKIHNLY